MKAISYSNIVEVNESDWEAASPHDFSHSITFLKIINDCNLENSTFRYLIFYQNDKPVGTAVLSKFDLHLDLLSKDRIIKNLKTFGVKIFRRNLFTIQVICCGIPCSFGQQSFFVVDKTMLKKALEITHQQMINWSDESGSGLLLWKELMPDHLLHSCFRDLNYIRLPSLHDHRILINQSDPGTFISNFRSAYKRKYKEMWKLSSGEGPTWEDDTWRFLEKPFTRQDVNDFYAGYESVMSRVEYRLETYPYRFFDLLSQQSDINTTLVQLINKTSNENLSALLVPNGRTMWFILVSKREAVYTRSLYQKFIQLIVLFSINKGYTDIRLGQTSNFTKMSAGATAHRLEIYFLMRSKWKHKLLNRYGKHLFHEEKLPDIHPMHSQKAISLRNYSTSRVNR